MSEALMIQKYDKLLAGLDQTGAVSEQMKSEIKNFTIDNVKLESVIDVYDLTFASVFGILATAISGSQAIERFSDGIHDIASGKSVTNSNPLQRMLGGLLEHHGDTIDSAVLEDGSKLFLNREGNPTGPFMHRLLRGHDPLSMNGDNPFKVLTSQYGITKGITQSIRHLVGDTFSKEGLPIPGHSFFDVTRSDGRLSNYFIEVSRSLSGQSSKANMRDVYEGLFTIKAQEIAAQGLLWALCLAYIRLRKIEDRDRVRQIKIIAYGVNFFVHAGKGMVKQGGIPYIHWPALVMLSKEFAGMYLDSYRDIRELEKKTVSLISGNDLLEKKVFETGRTLKSFDSADEYLKSVQKEKNEFTSLTDFFEED